MTSDTRRLIELRRLRAQIDNEISQLEHRVLQRILASSPRDATEAVGLQRRSRARCGTESGFAKHRRHGEEPCMPCRDAHNEGERQRRARRKAREAAA